MDEEEKQEAQVAAPEATGVEQLLAQAQQVEMMGIPVDWKALCMKIYSVANQSIKKLNATMEELQVALDAAVDALKEHDGSE